MCTYPTRDPPRRPASFSRILCCKPPSVTDMARATRSAVNVEREVREVTRSE
jgi:hypothetical protein